MARDLRQLREEAAEAAASGKHKRALAAYLELERVEPRDAQWSKRAAEIYRKLGKDKDAIAAYARSADRYASGGFLVQAMAVCKLILQIDPKNADALHRTSSMNEQIGAGPTRASTMADNNPTLAENASVAALRGTGALPALRAKKPTTHPPQNIPRTRTPPTGAPPIAMSRTKSKPISLEPGSGIVSVSLKREVPNAALRADSQPGVYVIPLDTEIELEDEPARPSVPVIEIEDANDVIDLEPQDVDEATELELNDIEEIPLPEPRAMGVVAARALASTPLFAGLPSEALEALVAELELVPLPAGEVLFREGDPGDALYVVVEGEVAVLAEGPPRVEMARLGPSAFIGEVALMTDQPRSATVTAVIDTELLRIDRQTLSTVLASHGEVLNALLRFVRDRLVDRWTRTSPLFRPFGDEERAELAARFKFLDIEANTKLIDAGSKPDGLYIVLAGTFEVRRAGSPVAQLGPGELIGETALLSGGVFKSDVVARGKSLALCLPAAVFREVIMTHPHVLEYIGEHAEASRRLQIL